MQHSILIVDDEKPILFALKRYFSKFNYEVDTVEELEEAKVLMFNFNHSIVITDLCLDGVNRMGGFELIKYIRERSSKTWIIVLTAFGAREIEAEALKLGADALLHKPQPLAELAQFVFGLLELKREATNTGADRDPNLTTLSKEDPSRHGF